MTNIQEMLYELASSDIILSDEGLIQIEKIFNGTQFTEKETAICDISFQVGFRNGIYAAIKILQSYKGHIDSKQEGELL